MRVGLLAMTHYKELRILIAKFFQYDLPISNHCLIDNLVNHLLAKHFNCLLNSIYSRLSYDGIIYHRYDILRHITQVHVFNTFLNTRVHFCLHSERLSDMLRISYVLTIDIKYNINTLGFKDLRLFIVTAILVKIVVQSSAKACPAAYSYPHSSTSFS